MRLSRAKKSKLKKFRPLLRWNSNLSVMQRIRIAKKYQARSCKQLWNQQFTVISAGGASWCLDWRRTRHRFWRILLIRCWGLCSKKKNLLWRNATVLGLLSQVPQGLSGFVSIVQDQLLSCYRMRRYWSKPPHSGKFISVLIDPLMNGQREETSSKISGLSSKNNRSFIISWKMERSVKLIGRLR